VLVLGVGFSYMSAYTAKDREPGSDGAEMSNAQLKWATRLNGWYCCTWHWFPCYRPSPRFKLLDPDEAQDWVVPGALAQDSLWVSGFTVVIMVGLVAYAVHIRWWRGIVELLPDKQ